MTENAFQQLFLKARIDCVSKLYNITLSKEEAEDAFMEAVYALWRDIKAGDVKHTANLKGLLFVMAKNWWLSKKRKKSVANLCDIQSYTISNDEFYNSEAFQVESDYDPLLKVEEEQLLQNQVLKKNDAFNKAFKKLSKKQQKLLVHNILHKKGLQEIKDVLGYVSIHAVKMDKYRCKKVLIQNYEMEMAKE